MTEAAKMVADEGGVLKLAGPVIIETHVAMRESAASYIGQADWIVDWSAVTDVDSSALALLFAWERASHAAGKTIRSRGLPVNLASLAELYGVAELLPTTSASLS